MGVFYMILVLIFSEYGRETGDLGEHAKLVKFQGKVEKKC
jgi:hypothetical protein